MQPPGQNANEILDKIVLLHERVLKAAAHAATGKRAEALRLFVANDQKAHLQF